RLGGVRAAGWAAGRRHPPNKRKSVRGGGLMSIPPTFPRNTRGPGVCAATPGSTYTGQRAMRKASLEPQSAAGDRRGTNSKRTRATPLSEAKRQAGQSEQGRGRGNQQKEDFVARAATRIPMRLVILAARPEQLIHDQARTRKGAARLGDCGLPRRADHVAFASTQNENLADSRATRRIPCHVRRSLGETCSRPRLWPPPRRFPPPMSVTPTPPASSRSACGTTGSRAPTIR